FCCFLVPRASSAADAQSVRRCLIQQQLQHDMPTIRQSCRYSSSFSYRQSMIRYVRRGCLLLLVIAAVLVTARLLYGLTRPSALGQLARLAHIERTTDLARVQAALLQQLP